MNIKRIKKVLPHKILTTNTNYNTTLINPFFQYGLQWLYLTKSVSLKEEQLIAIAINELTNPTSEASIILLETHTYVTENGDITISRVKDVDKNTAVVYAPVAFERFYFAIYIDVTTQKVIGIYTESWNRIQFTANSTTYTAAQLKQLTTIPSAIVNDNMVRATNSRHSSLSIAIDFSKPDDVLSKINDLLDLLETDPNGVKQLVEKANGTISIAIEYHIGTGNLGEFNLDNKLISRMNALGVAINFHFFAKGTVMPTPFEKQMSKNHIK